MRKERTRPAIGLSARGHRRGGGGLSRPLNIPRRLFPSFAARFLVLVFAAVLAALTPLFAAETFAQGGATLTATNISADTATLNLSGHTTAWWYEGSQSNAQCTSVTSGTTTVDLSSLSPGTSYTYTAYSATGCNSSDKLDDDPSEAPPNPAYTHAEAPFEHLPRPVYTEPRPSGRRSPHD